MNRSNSRLSTNHLVVISLLTAMSYVSMLLIRIKFFNFLTYDPKDVVIMLAGMAFGPLVTIIMSLAVSFIEFVTVSGDGVMGLLMNILSTVSYVTVATVIYRKDKTTKSLIIGLIIGSILMSIVMVGWNYLITPIYLGIPRAEVVKLLVPVILPFNLIKSTINSVIIILIHKPVIEVLKQSKVYAHNNNHPKTNIILGAIMIISIIVLVYMFTSL